MSSSHRQAVNFWKCALGFVPSKLSISRVVTNVSLLGPCTQALGEWREKEPISTIVHAHYPLLNMYLGKVGGKA